MKNVDCVLDWPTFCGVENGTITVIPFILSQEVEKGDTITCSHLYKKIVKRVKDVLVKDVWSLTDYQIKKMGFQDIDCLEYVFVEKYGHVIPFFKFVILDDYNSFKLNQYNPIVSLSTSTLGYYNPEYDDKPWRD